MIINLHKLLLVLEEKVQEDLVVLELEVNGKQILATIELLSNGHKHVYDVYQEELDF